MLCCGSVVFDHPERPQADRINVGATGAPAARSGRYLPVAGPSRTGSTCLGGCLPPPDAHLHGYHDSVLRLHRWRTAEDSAGYAYAVLRGPKVGRVRLGQLPPSGADPHSQGSPPSTATARRLHTSSQASAALASTSAIHCKSGDGLSGTGVTLTARPRASPALVVTCWSTRSASSVRHGLPRRTARTCVRRVRARPRPRQHSQSVLGCSSSPAGASPHSPAAGSSYSEVVNSGPLPEILRVSALRRRMFHEYERRCLPNSHHRTCPLPARFGRSRLGAIAERRADEGGIQSAQLSLQPK